MSSTDMQTDAAPKKVQRDFRPVRSSGPMATPSGGAGSSSSSKSKKKREKRVYTFADLMTYKEANKQRPEGLPEMTITTSSGGGGGGRDENASWSRGQAQPAGRNDRDRRSTGGGDNWTRAPPPAPGSNRQGGGRNDRYERNDNHFNDRRNDRYDREPDMRPPESLRPVVNNTNLKIWKKPKVGGQKDQVRKKVFGILNKMTKDRFTKLSEELCAQPIESMEILRSVILLVFDKALMEPAFGDMYSDLCLMLQKKLPTNNFVRTVKDYDSDQYYWTADNDINDEVAGPYDKFEHVRDAAKTNVDSVKVGPRPTDVTLQIEDYLVEKKNAVKIFVGDNGKYYAVATRVPANSVEVGLMGPFADKTGAEEKAKKNMSFKRMLLNQCQVEYEKENEVLRFDGLIEEHKKKADTMDPKQHAAELEDLTFDRLKVKRRCLGNISFIGQLYVKRMLQEKIMHECICNLSGIEFDGKNVKNGDPASYKVVKRPDEEDIESLCKLMATIGKFFDHKKQPAHEQKMGAYMKRLAELHKDESLNSRYRFMAMDTVDLRRRNWIPRIKEEEMKTLGEIKKEHMQQTGKGFPRGPPRQSGPPKGKGGGYRDGGGDRDRRGYDDRRGDDRRGGGGKGSYGGGKGGGYQQQGGRRDDRGQGSYGGDRRDSGKGGGRGFGGDRMGGDRMGGSRYGGERSMGGGGYATSFTGGSFTGGGKGKGKPQGRPQDGRGEGKGFRPNSNSQSRDAPSTSGRDAPPSQRPAKAAPAAAAVKFDKDGQWKIIKTFIDDNMFPDCMQSVSGHTVEELTAFGELAIFKAVDMKDRERRKVFEMLDQLLESCKDFTPAVILPGLGKVIPDIPDLIVDIPLVCDYIGGFIGKRLVAGHITMEWFLGKCNEKNDPEYGMSIIESSRGGKLIAAIAKTLSKEEVAKLLNKEAVLPFLGSEDFDEFVKKSELGDKF